MKTNILILSWVFLMFFNVSGQEKSQVSKRDGKVEKTLQTKIIMEKIGELLTDTAFMFNATDMAVRGAGNMNLSYKCDVQVKNEIVISYLPFIGKAYYVSTDIENSGFDFTRPIQNYHFNKTKSGYDAVIKVRNGNDLLTYNFYITKTGCTTLTVGSTRRQSISFYGSISELN